MTALAQRTSTVTGYLRRSCPGCSQNVASTGTVQSARHAESLSFEALQQQWYGFFKDKVFFSYNRCATCGLVYAPSYFTEPQLSELYASMPANMAEVEPGSLHATQRGYFDAIRDVLPSGGDFLEVGPDVGLFAEHCVSTGKFARAWMFEPNVRSHEEMRQRLSGVDVRISTSLTDLSQVPNGSISFAAMIHVLDHLIDPTGYLRDLLPKLRADAILLVVTHNERSLLARALGPRWPAYCLQHPQLFKPKSMREIMRASGFEVSKTIRSVNHFKLPYLIRHLLLAAKLDFIKVPAPAIDVPLRLGNFITLARPASDAA